jgi:uncharacterized protein YbjT (DUF2867 family)
MRFKTIITGATGMVGEGVLLECLNHPAVEQILVINRKPGGLSHPKLREIIHTDFLDLASIEAQLAGYDACFFCLGVSSVGMSQQEYKHITYDLTLNVAQLLAKGNPDMTFCYITGAGTDSSEVGRIAWARVKGATENALLRLFKRAYMFRPGFMKATPGQKKRKELLPMVGLGIPYRSCTVPRRLLYVAGSRAGDDQRGYQGLPSTDSGSEGHRTVGESLMRRPPTFMPSRS